MKGEARGLEDGRLLRKEYRTGVTSPFAMASRDAGIVALKCSGGAKVRFRLLSDFNRVLASVFLRHNRGVSCFWNRSTGNERDLKWTCSKWLRAMSVEAI